MAVIRKSRIVDSCQSLPPLPESNIPRDNLLDTIERMFRSDINVVVIEGEEGIGKTTLMSQFSNRHGNDSISVFIRPTSRFAYEMSTIRHDLCSQLNAILKPVTNCDPYDSSDGYLMDMFARLRSISRRAPVYLVLDGIEAIEDRSIQIAILDAFPIGEPRMPLVLSGDQSLLRSSAARMLNIKTLQVVNFSLDETERYFADLGVGRADLEEIYNSCGRGVPAYLASVRRSIRAGAEPRSLALRNLNDFFEVEWARKASSEETSEMLS